MCVKFGQAPSQNRVINKKHITQTARVYKYQIGDNAISLIIIIIALITQLENKKLQFSVIKRDLCLWKKL